VAEPREPVAVGKLLESVLGSARYAQVKEQIALEKAWEEIAGPGLAAHVRPFALLSGVLWLEADSPPYAQAAQLQSVTLAEGANRVLAREAVREVRLTKRQPPGRSQPRK